MFFLGVEGPGPELDLSPSTGVEVKMNGTIPPFPLYTRWFKYDRDKL
jgi:hypothetical protein